MNFNRQFGVELEQPKTLAERQGVAKICKSHLAFDIPILVDTLADEVGHAYSGGPARLYLIDRQGRVAYKGGRGPFYFFPSELESAIMWNLSEAGQN